MNAGKPAMTGEEQPAPTGYKDLLRRYNSAPPDVQWFFLQLPRLLQDFPHEVTIAYMSAMVEQAKHRTLYCGIVRLHKANSAMARAAVDASFMERRRFKELFHDIFGQPIAPHVLSSLERAETVRDKVLHGKPTQPPGMRRAIADYLSFAAQFNDLVLGKAGFRPFGRLTGVAKGNLDKSTTRWLLKGMGLPLG